MDDGMSVSHIPGYAIHSGAVAQTRPKVIDVPAIQYPIDDTMPVKAWVFEVQPPAQDPVKPLRPDVERKAIEAINRHLPPWDQIKIPQGSHTSRDVALHSKQRLHSETQVSHTSTELALHSRQRLYPEFLLPLPPRIWDDHHREAAARFPGSPKASKPIQGAGKKTTRHVTSMDWTETEDMRDEEAWTAGWENNALVVAAPDLIVTRPDGKMRRLQHPNP